MQLPNWMQAGSYVYFTGYASPVLDTMISRLGTAFVQTHDLNNVLRNNPPQWNEVDETTLWLFQPATKNTYDIERDLNGFMSIGVHDEFLSYFWQKEQHIALPDWIQIGAYIKAMGRIGIVVDVVDASALCKSFLFIKTSEVSTPRRRQPERLLYCAETASYFMLTTQNEYEREMQRLASICYGDEAEWKRYQATQAEYFKRIHDSKRECNERVEGKEK